MATNPFHINDPNKPTRRRSDQAHVVNLTRQNKLHKFASYNALFTLSALSENDILNTTTLLNSVPHDIIIQSGGMGGSANKSEGENFSSWDHRTQTSNQEALSNNERMKKTLQRAIKVSNKNRDLYIKSVTMTSIPGLNDKRPLTSVSKIQMIVEEPVGITLLDRLRAAAANNGYLDHLDAPYMLTVTWKGWDEHGKEVHLKEKESLKRIIPIKITDMDIDVTATGTIYDVTAIPYNEFAYVNRFAGPRTTGTVKGHTPRLICKNLQELLNKQTKDEKSQRLNEKPDEYIISIDEALEPDTKISFTGISSKPMYSQSFEGADAGFANAANRENEEFLKFTPGTSITQLLMDVMRGHPKFQEDAFKEWKAKVTGQLQTLAGAYSNGKETEETKQKIYETTLSEKWYYKRFKITATVVPKADAFDWVRGTNAKIITFHIEPYWVHAYSLAIPGVSTGKNFEAFVHKTYNYIFTGTNVDILNLDINYRLGYFASRIKNVDGEATRHNQTISFPKAVGTDASDHFQDGSLLYKTEAGISSAASSGTTTKRSTQLDQFMDSITHPLADMVNIRLEILGDPAWLGQSQFIPANIFPTGPGVGNNKNMHYWRGSIARIWNETFECYNTDVADPIIMLNFRMPTDYNNKTGLYELGSSQAGTFSGLYRVFQIENLFEEGAFKQVLHCARFNNQGVLISDPITEYTAADVKGNHHILSNYEYKNIFEQHPHLSGGKIDSVINIGNKIQTLIANAKSNVKSKIKKSFKKFKERILT